MAKGSIPTIPYETDLIEANIVLGVYSKSFKFIRYWFKESHRSRVAIPYNFTFL